MSEKLGKNLGWCVLCNEVIEPAEHLFSFRSFFSTIWKAVRASIGVLHPQLTFERLGIARRERNFSTERETEKD